MKTTIIEQIRKELENCPLGMGVAKDIKYVREDIDNIKKNNITLFKKIEVLQETFFDKFEALYKLFLSILLTGAVTLTITSFVLFLKK